MAGQIVNAVKIRRGWLIMILICTALSAALIPFCYLYIGGLVSWRAKKQDQEGGDGVEMEQGRSGNEEVVGGLTPASAPQV